MNKLFLFAASILLFTTCTNKIEEDVNGGVNLSREGTANCYIAQTNRRYSFRATVKGNSNISVGNPSTASVVWETLNSSTKPNVGDVVRNIVLSNNYVTFETAGNEGNALIAVMDKYGNILWSWHIWVTSYNPATNYDIYNGFENLKVMDRNLGALSNEKGTKSVGLIYQWGRKEPFMGCASNYTFASTVDMVLEASSNRVGTDEYAIRNPYTFIIASWQGMDWRYKSNNSAWGGKKTELDPCPYGWKIPEGGSDGLWKNFKLGTFDDAKGGMVFGSTSASHDVWMPAQGFMSDSDTYYTGWWQVGQEGRYWTVTTLGDKYSEFFYFKPSEIGISHRSEEWSVHCSRATGMAVRCVEDK